MQSPGNYPSDAYDQQNLFWYFKTYFLPFFRFLKKILLFDLIIKLSSCLMGEVCYGIKSFTTSRSSSSDTEIGIHTRNKYNNHNNSFNRMSL